MKKALHFLRKNPEIIFFICAFILWTALMCYQNAKEGGDFKWHDLKVEANGMIFDLFVFGILVTTYNAIRARKEKIERLHEEIDDYRGWNEKEAMYRIVGAIKRLNKEGVTKIILNNCFLSGADLRKANLSGANLKGAKLDGADLRKVNLSGAYLQDASLEEADLWAANLEGANLEGANLQRASLRRTILTNANLRSVNLELGNLQQAILSGAQLSGANLRGAILLWVKAYGAHFGELEIKDYNNTREILLLGRELDKQARRLGTPLHEAMDEKRKLIDEHREKKKYLPGANLEQANLSGACLDDSVLRGAIFHKSDFSEIYQVANHTSLEGATVESDWFEKLEKWEVEGREKIIRKYVIGENGALQLK